MQRSASEADRGSIDDRNLKEDKLSQQCHDRVGIRNRVCVSCIEMLQILYCLQLGHTKEPFFILRPGLPSIVVREDDLHTIMLQFSNT